MLVHLTVQLRGYEELDGAIVDASLRVWIRRRRLVDRYARRFETRYVPLSHQPTIKVWTLGGVSR